MLVEGEHVSEGILKVFGRFLEGFFIRIINFIGVFISELNFWNILDSSGGLLDAGTFRSVS